MRACLCECVHARVHARVRAFVRASVRDIVRACVRAIVRVIVRACERAVHPPVLLLYKKTHIHTHSGRACALAMRRGRAYDAPMMKPPPAEPPSLIPRQ